MTVALVVGVVATLTALWDLRRLKLARRRALRVAKQQIPLPRRSAAQLNSQHQEIERAFARARRRTLTRTGVVCLCVMLILALSGR